jgi:hypothetical protein
MALHPQRPAPAPNLANLRPAVPLAGSPGNSTPPLAGYSGRWAAAFSIVKIIGPIIGNYSPNLSKYSPNNWNYSPNKYLNIRPITWNHSPNLFKYSPNNLKLFAQSFQKISAKFQTFE